MSRRGGGVVNKHQYSIWGVGLSEQEGGGVVNKHQYSLWGVGLSEQDGGLGGGVEEESDQRVVLKDKVREGSGRKYQSFLFQV